MANTMRVLSHWSCFWHCFCAGQLHWTNVVCFLIIRYHLKKIIAQSEQQHFEYDLIHICFFDHLGSRQNTYMAQHKKTDCAKSFFLYIGIFTKLHLFGVGNVTIKACTISQQHYIIAILFMELKKARKDIYLVVFLSITLASAPQLGCFLTPDWTLLLLP
jgi:hypothetical protein